MIDKMSNKDDGYYIGEVLNGNTSAFAILVDRHKDMAYNLSYKIVHNSEDAEEITQDAFVKAYRSLARFKGDARFSTWLYRIVYNSSISHIRKKQREIPVDNKSVDMLKYSGLTDEQDPKDDELLAVALRMAVDSLPVQEKTMITLYYYQNTSIEEIAQIMSLSGSNVKVRLFRTRKKLYEHIRSRMKSEVSTNL